MHRIALHVSIPCCLLCGIGAATDLSDAEIRQVLIRQSIAAYPGNCPCPYNVDRAGRQCGVRSAYNKPGGHAPLCFPADVTDELIAKYRSKAVERGD